METKEKTLKAGRELDALVAERVMGYTRRQPEFPDDEHPWWVAPGYKLNLGIRIFHPSTNISEAWEVVEKMKDCKLLEIRMNKKGVSVHWNEGPGHYDGRVVIESAETAPLAICLAALKAFE